MKKKTDATLGVMKHINERDQPRVLRVESGIRKTENKRRIIMPDKWVFMINTRKVLRSIRCHELPGYSCLSSYFSDLPRMTGAKFLMEDKNMAFAKNTQYRDFKRVITVSAHSKKADNGERFPMAGVKTMKK